MDVGTLVPVPVDLSKLTDVLKKEVVKKTDYNELVENDNYNNTTDTSNLVKKTDSDTKTSKIEKKLLIMIMLNILLLKNLINECQKILLQDCRSKFSKQK